MSEISPYEVKPHQPEPEARRYTAREVFMRRVMFWLGIAAFVAVALIPFFFVVLAALGEMTIPLPGDYPDSNARVWMVMEARERGIAYSAPSYVDEQGDFLTVETRVRYLLWEGENENLVFCSRYERSGASWVLAESAGEGACAR